MPELEKAGVYDLGLRIALEMNENGSIFLFIGTKSRSKKSVNSRKVVRKSVFRKSKKVIYGVDLQSRNCLYSSQFRLFWAINVYFIAHASLKVSIVIDKNIANVSN